MPTGDHSDRPLTADESPPFDSTDATLISRDERSNTWRQGDGTSVKRIYTDQINFKDAAGEWKPIDTRIVEDGKGNYKNTAGPADVTFAGSSSAEDLVRIDKDGWSLAFTLENVATGKSAATESSAAQYSSVRPKTDLKYELHPTAVKELLVVKEAPADASATHWSFPLKLDALIASETAGGIDLRTTDGDLAARIPPGVMFDAKGAEHDVAISLSTKDGSPSVEVDADVTWLQDPDRAYPVSVDPTINFGTSDDTFASEGTPTTNSSGRDYGRIGWDATYQLSRTFMKFNVSSLAGQNILGAWFHGSFIFSSTYPAPTVLNIKRVTSAWSSSSLTWVNQPSISSTDVDDAKAAQGDSIAKGITPWVQNWISGAWPNNGVALDAADNDQSRYKHIAMAEHADATLRPFLEVEYGSASPATTAVAPADEAVLKTPTPHLQVNSVTDPDGDPVRYYFRVATGPDANSGEFVNSGWLSSTSWDVPVGGLQDGVTYFWTAWTKSSSGSAVTYPPWIRSFTVDVGLGSPPGAPTDGPVNLATGNLTFGTSSPSYPTVGGGIGLSYNYNSKTPPLHGLQANYYEDVNQNQAFDDTGGQTQRIDPMVDFAWSYDSPYPSIPDNYFLARWQGSVKIPTAGTGSWSFGANTDGGVRVWVNNTLVVDRWFEQRSFRTPHYGTALNLVGGNSYPIKIEYFETTGGATIYVAAKGPGIADHTVLPPDWLKPLDAGPLPDGWSLSEDAAGSLTYVRAVVTDNAVTLLEADGFKHEYKRKGSGFEPPEGEHGVLTTDRLTGKLVFHGDDALVYTYRTDGVLESAATTVDDHVPAASVYTWSGTPARLTSIKDPLSNRTVSLTYAGGSCPTPPLGFDLNPPTSALCKVTYWDGRATNLYYVSGHLARIEDPGSELTDFAYDASGRLAKIRDPLAADAVAAAAQTQRIDDDSTRTLITYDAQNRVASVEGPAPTLAGLRPKHIYTYDATFGITTIDYAGMSGAEGYDRRVDFDSLGRQTYEFSPDGIQLVQNTWDGFGNLVTTNDPLGRMTSNIYDEQGRLTDAYGPAPNIWFDHGVPLAAHASKVPRTSTFYDDTTGIHSLAATFWANDDLSGQPKCYGTGVGVPTDEIVKDWGSSTAPTCLQRIDDWSAMLTGDVQLPDSGTYQLKVYNDEGSRLYVDDQPIIDAWDTPGWTQGSFTTTTLNERHRIQLEFRDSSGIASIELRWIRPGGAQIAIPGEYLFPNYSLVTDQITHDAQAGTIPRVQTYPQPHTGLASAETVDPFSLDLATQMTYEPAGSGYSRPKTRTLPAGNTWTYDYYGVTQTLPSAPCSIGTSTKQAGLLHTRSGPGPSPRVEEFAYDSAGRQAASRIGSDPWSCTTFDTRGRPASQTIPALFGQPARTVTSNYAVGSNPLVTSVSDTAGTITATTDLLSRVVSYTDVWGKTTTATYDQVGRVTQTSGPAGTQDYIHDSGSGRLASQKLDGLTVAVPTYNGSGELTSVSYPSGAGKTGNGTSLASITRDDSGRTTGLTWNQANGSLLTSDLVTRSQSGRVIDQSIDGTDPRPSANNFSYDAAGRLTDAWVPGRHSTYAFAASVGCGSLNTAGKNTNRTSVTIDGGAPITYCYDQADRLTSTTDARYPSIVYDTHGNTTTLGPEQMTYDGADRHIRTDKGDTVVTYVRDATDRIVSRTASNVSTVAFRSAESANTGSGAANSLVVDKPAGLGEGDVMLLHVSARGGVTTNITPPTGWSVVRVTANNPTMKGGVYWKKATAADASPSTTTYTVGFNVAVQAAGGIGAWSGVDGANPVQEWQEATANASPTVTVPQIVNASAKGSLVALFALLGEGITPPSTPAPGMTERWDEKQTGAAPPLSTTSEMSERPITAAGPTGTRTASTSDPSSWVGHLVALKPATVTTVTRYGFSGDGDSSDFTLDSSNSVSERVIALPGGATVTKRASGDVWSYPNIHGDVVSTCNASGAKQGTTRSYDPYGEALDAAPDNSAGDFDYGWLGQQKRPTEAEAGIATIQMGARPYIPALGRFTRGDPAEGGSANDYEYSMGDSVNGVDLNGRACWSSPSCMWARYRARRNFFWSLLGIGIAYRLHATCHRRKGLMIVCTGATFPTWLAKRTNGFTIGNVFITTLDTVSRRLLAHETKHADQYAIFGGWLFLLSYFADWAISVGISYWRRHTTRFWACYHVLEIWAGLRDGEYRHC